MQLNCKVIKKWQPPYFYINPLFSGLFPLSSKIFGTPQVNQFLEGPTTAPPPTMYPLSYIVVFIALKP